MLQQEDKVCQRDKLIGDIKDVSILDVKKFWNNRPCNIYHSEKKLGTREYFDEVEKKKYKAEPHIIAFGEFDKWKGKNVLEIGCGIGTTTTSFAKAGANITAIDLSDVSVNLCKKRLDVYGLKGNIMEANAEQLDKTLLLENFTGENENNKFDLIYSFGVIHHTPNPKKVIEHLSKYIKKDGELRLMLYSFVSYKVFQIMQETNNWNMSEMRNIIQKYSEAQVGCPCTYVYTFEDVKELLEPYFKIKKIWKDHIFIWDIEEYKKNNFVKAKPWQNVSDTEIKKLESELGWHTMIIAEPK